MGFSPKKLCAVVVALAICAFLSAAGASDAQEGKPAGWYVGASVGINKVSGIEQAGHNRDNICYPDDVCERFGGGGPEGYRWYYDLDADDGAASAQSTASAS